MLKKTCPKCGQDSYSASEFALLICPHCEANMRYEKAVPAGNNDYIGDCFWCGDRVARFPSGKLICQNCGQEQKIMKKGEMDA